MKKHILKSLNLFLLSSLFLSNVSIVHAKVDIKKLKEKFDFVGRARRERKDARDKYDACIKDICQTEKTAAQDAHAEWHRTTYPSIHGERARNEFYRAYKRSDEAYQLCLKKQKQCGAAYEKMIQAENKLSRRLKAIELATIGTVVGTLALGALGAGAIVRGVEASTAAKIINKHKVIVPSEITLLKQLGSTGDSEMLKGKTLSPEAVNAAAEIYYFIKGIGRVPTNDDVIKFKKEFNIIVQEPEWKPGRLYEKGKQD